jgi:tetratricopeptide (TPR) repeat protein
LRYRATAEVVFRRVAAERPLVLVADDIHWADASSAEVLGQLLPLGDELRILFLLAGRPDRETAGWRLVEAARETFGEALSELTLARLDDADSRSLVANLLEIESLPERLRRFILERAEGNPFFVEEVIRMLIEREWVVLRDGRWVGSETVAAAEVPPTLAGLLTARIDRLPAGSRAILRVGAVIGRDIPAPLLEAVTGDPPATARALGLAEAAGLIRIASVDPEPVYRFHHVLIQEAAYTSLLKADRRRLHREVGEAIEARDPDRLEEFAPVLGIHFERAGETERAVKYLHRAGRAALRRFAVHEARDLLDRAAALLVDLPDGEATDRRRIEVDLDRIAAGATFIPYDQQLAELARTRSRAAALGDDRLLGLTLALEAAERRSLGDPALAEATEGALEIGRRLRDPQILGGPLGIMGLILARQGRRSEATAYLEEAIAQLERIQTADAAYYAGELGVIQAERGEFDLADGAFARARVLAARSGDPTALADADIFEGMSLAMQGRHDEALALADRGTAAAAAVGNLSCQAVGSWVAGEQELALGRFEPAMAWLEKANDIAGFCQAVNVERMSAATLGVARAKAGAGAAALRGLDDLLEQARAAEDPLSEALILLRRGEANATVENGDPAQARADLEASIAIFRAMETRPYLDQAEHLYLTVSNRAPSTPAADHAV